MPSKAVIGDRNPVFPIGSGCPIKDFGHDKNKNSNLYTDIK
jgi:hypothetical protein